MIELRDVLHDDYKFLYDLLAQRDATINISHKSMPHWDQHVKFLSRTPYPYHKIIWYGDVRVGVCYVTAAGEIGIFIDRDHQRCGYGTQAVKEIIRIHAGRRLLANVAPLNTKSQALFMGLGFELIQYTYALNRAQSV